MSDASSSPLHVARRLRDSIPVRLLVIAFLVLSLLIPLAMVRSLVDERQVRQRSVESDVGAQWGGAQTVGGPLLIVPYTVRAKDEKGRVTTWLDLAFFLPDTLNVRARLLPERRGRGIFETVVYRADIHLAGFFARPDFGGWDVAAADVLWEQAVLSLGISDLRSIRGAAFVHWGGVDTPWGPGSGPAGTWSGGLSAPAPGLRAVTAAAPIAFKLDLALNGSGALSFLPLGKETVADIASPWPTPSFSGAFLPEGRTMSAAGFDAHWRVSYFGRSFPQRWRRGEAEQVASAGSVRAAAFGVGLFQPADAYQKTERSVKYGVLFLVLTFLTFFLFEVLSPVALHPVQYLLIGAALCLFYLLLLSTSEQVEFARAYTIAATATVGLIAAYSWAILAGLRRSLILAALLAALYGYLYVLLQAEDYALLLGSIGLFVVLAAVMYITRRLDWSRERRLA